jgi:membrane-bound lytic murein transglycosylase A
MPGLRRGFPQALALIGLAAAGLAGCASVETPIERPGSVAPPAATPLAPPPPASAAPTAPHVRLEALDQLPGWSQEDHLAALEAYKRGCGVARAPLWRGACRRAREQSILDEASARAFFEDNFRAEVRTATGLLTGYFAPVYEARDVPDEIFSAPVLPRPDDLVLVQGADGARRAFRIGADGPEPYPDRAAIEAQPVARALAFMKPEDLFFLQVQGSGSLTFPDGRRQRVIYAGDNGRPFVGVARPMAEAGLLSPARTSADAIRAWLAEHRGPEAAAVMDKDPRYVFFTLAPDEEREPSGSAGVELPPGRSIAVDPSFHAYGELYWIDASAPVLTGAARTYRRLAVALDSGAAIRGDVRADLYLGRGEDAGLEAGRVRHTLLLIRLVPLEGGRRAGGGRDEKIPSG